MSKQTKARIDKLEHFRAIEMAKDVCAMKDNPEPTKEKIARVIEFMQVENLHAFILRGLQERIDQMSKIEKSR